MAERLLRIEERTKNGLLLFYTDLDSLKKINDDFGHKSGDEAIAETSSILKEVFRKMDITLLSPSMLACLQRARKNVTDEEAEREKVRYFIHGKSCQEYLNRAKDQFDGGYLCHFQQGTAHIRKAPIKLQNCLLLWAYTARPARAGAHHCS